MSPNLRAKPGPMDDWQLACDIGSQVAGATCDMVWADDESNMSAIELHFTIDHAAYMAGGGTIAIRTVWIGKGPEPARPNNRAARRRQRTTIKPKPKPKRKKRK